MGISRRVEFGIRPFLEPFAGQNIRQLNQSARQIAQQIQEPLQNIGITLNPNSIKGLQSLQKFLAQINASIQQTNNGLRISAQNAEGVSRSINLQTLGQTDWGVNGVTTTANRLSSVKELQNAYNNLFGAIKQVQTLEKQGESHTPAWEEARGTVELYERNLEELIATLVRRHHLSTEMNDDLGKELIAGKGQIAQTQEAMEHQRRQMELNHEVTMSSKARQSQQQAEAKAHQENTQKVREYVSALKEQWEQENKLATLKKSKAPQNQINQQQKVVKMATDHTNALKNQVKGTKEYTEVEKQLEYAQEKQKQKQLELNQTTKKSTSLFGNFAHTLKQVVSAGLSWKIFSTIMNTLKDVQNTVIDLDKSLVDLQIVMGSTREEARTMLSTYSQMAQKLGSTTKEIATQAVEWQRQGYSVEDTNTLIKNSTVLAKVGMLEEAEAQEYLTAAMKGFNVSVNQSLGIVDQLTAVDMKAAVSAGGLAEGMSRTANAAQMAGVEMNQLLGYLAVVGETTQKSMSSIGESFKTIFARFGNIKAGKFVDDETGESLNDVAKVLSEFNIQLYDSEGNMKNVNTILTQLSQGWGNYTQVQKNAIASAVAGVRQYENFIVLMNNFGKAQQYATIATESSGTAMEKFGAYTEGVEAKINTFKSTFEEFSQNLLNSDLIGKLVDAGTGLLKIADNLKLVQIAFVALIGVGAVKGLTTLGAKLNELNNSAQNFVTLNKAMGASFRGFNVSAQQAKANLLALALQTEITGINFANMSKQQVVSTIINANAINAFKGLTKAEIEETLASLGVAEADKAEVAAAIQNILTRQGQTVSIKALTQATWLHIKAMLKEIATMVIAHPIISAIVTAIALLTAGLIYASKEEERLAERVEETSQAFEDAKNKVDETTSSLEENQKRIKELESQGSLTYVEQEELKNLKSATAELKLQLEYYKQIAKEKAEESIEAKEEKLEKHTKQGAFGTPILEAKNIADRISKIKEQEKDLEEAYQHLEDLRSGKIEETEASNGIMGGVFEDTVESTKTNISLIKASLETLTKDSKKMLEEYQSLIKDYELLPAEELTPDKKQRLEELRQEYQQLYLGLYPEQYKKIKWDEVLGLEEFKGAKEAIQKVVDANGDNADVVEMLKTAYPDLITKLKEFGIEEDEIIEQFKKQETVVNELSHDLETLKDTYETLNSAINEYNSNGSISYDTWEKLLKIEDQYLAALVDENGQMKSNNQALQDLIATKIEDQTMTRIETYVNNLLTAAQNGTLEQTLLLTDVTNSNTEARMANVMAIIAGNAALAEQANVIIPIIESMSKLSGSVSIGSKSTSDAKDATESWEKVLKYANKTLDDQIDKLKEQKEAIEKSIEEQIKAKEKQIELLEAEKEALQDKNEEKNKEIELEELQRNLQKAQQRTMRVYREGYGWTYEQDPEALKKAQQELDEFYTEQEIDNIDKRIEALEKEVENLEKTTDEEEDSYDKRLKMLDEQIKKAEDYKKKWNDVKTDYEHAQDGIEARAKLGAEVEQDILNGKIGVVNAFKDGYTGALGEVASSTEGAAKRVNTALGSFDFEKLNELLAIARGEIPMGIQEVPMSIGKKAQIVSGTKTKTEYMYNPFTKRYYKTSDISYDKNTGQYTVAAGTQWYAKPYASGTLSAKAGLANVDEKGRELIVPKQGRYRMMEYGDTVVPHNLSQRLFEVANNPLRFIANALNSVKSPNLLSSSNQTSNSSVINIGTIELPSVTNGENFVKQLQLIAANR